MAGSKRDRVWRAVLVGAAGLTLIAGLLQAVREEQLARPLAQGTPAPPFHASTREGGPFTLEPLGGKVVVLAFWATWCPPCRHEVPMLQRVAREYRGRGVELVTANLDEERFTAVEAFFGGRDEPLVVSPDDATVRAWRPFQLPTLYVIGRDGTVVASHASAVTEEVVRAEIERAIARPWPPTG